MKFLEILTEFWERDFECVDHDVIIFFQARSIVLVVDIKVKPKFILHFWEVKREIWTENMGVDIQPISPGDGECCEKLDGTRKFI